MYDGKDIQLFINAIDDITEWLSENLVVTNHITYLIEGLRIWIKISEILRKCKIYDKDDDDNTKKKVMKKMKEYIKWVKIFYKYGGEKFLKKQESGDIDIFYLHVVRYYMIPIMKDTWEKYECGVGIFTIQGFERRNKESKYSLSNHNNGKGNIMLQNIAHLCSKFMLN